MAENTCALCSVEIEPGKGHTIFLTESEQALTNKQLESFTYCDPCHRLMKDPQAAASLMTSLIESHLRRLGVYTSSSDFDRLKASLLNLALTKKSERPT